MTKPKSYMLAVPSQPRDIEEPQLFLDRLHTTGAFQLMSERMEEETLYLEINYEGELYSAEIYPTSFTIPELYRCQHLFPDVDAEAVRQRNSVLPSCWNLVITLFPPIIYS